MGEVMVRNGEHASPPATAPHALFGGGGSGGHVFPGLAVAAELRNRGWRVSWAGSARGMEARLVRQREIPFHDLPARPLIGQGVAGKARATLTLARTALTARGLVRRLDARVVIGTGGYVSAPAVLGARLASRPVLLVEPNAEPGFANRWLSRCAAAAVVAWESTAGELRCPARTTGVPVRAEFFTVAEELPAGSPLRLLVLGGSQGAQQLNEMLPQALAQLDPSLGPLAVCHQSGERHLEATRKAYAPGDSPSPEVEVVPFLDDVAAALAGAHLIISRAGAITLAELCAAGRPALLVPLGLAGGHQIGNARRLVEAGAAEMLPSAAATPKALAELLGRLLSDRERLAAMGRAARRLSHPDAAPAIADCVEQLGRRR